MAPSNEEHSFLNSIKHTFTPYDRRASQDKSQQTQNLPAANRTSNPVDGERRESHLSTASTGSTNTSTSPTTESYRDATGVGSQFLEDLTPGRQGRRRSSIMEALMGGGRQRRDSAGSGLERTKSAEQSMKDSGVGRGVDKYFKYVNN
ncbi:hypothetical protein JX266_012439 [Neoarthrinium moseri]|nr:hypothetical protein JX266_012439 [Neoarthrinium moseri]